MQIVVVSRKVTARPKSVGQRRLDDLLLHLAVERQQQISCRLVLAQVDQRILLGELRRARPAAHRRRSAGRAPRRSPASAARTCTRRPGCPRDAERVADPDAGQAPQLADLAGATRPARSTTPPCSKTPIPVTLRCLVTADREPVADPDGPAEHPDVRDLLPGRAALDLEDACRRRGLRGRRRRPAAGRSMPFDQRVDPGSGDRGAEEHRVHQRPPGLLARLARSRVGHGPSSTYAASSSSSCSASRSTAGGRRRRRAYASRPRVPSRDRPIATTPA